MRTFSKRRSFSKKPQPAVKRLQCWFVQEPENASEERRIYMMTGSKEQIDAQLLQPRTRLFVDGVDSRGPAVKIMLTYPKVQESTWHPETEGSYLIAFTGDKRPEHLQRIQLHFGSVSSPQSTKAAAHRVMLDILAKWPDLKPYLKCVKMACVFCKDHPDAPGGASVDVPLETLPAPCGERGVAKFFMGMM